MTYQTEFSDISIFDMPAIPADWRDISWHNDSCPSFETPCGAIVFVDCEDPASREVQGGARFTAMRDDAVICESDDWSEILDAVK